VPKYRRLKNLKSRKNSEIEVVSPLENVNLFTLSFTSEFTATSPTGYYRTLPRRCNRCATEFAVETPRHRYSSLVFLLGLSKFVGNFYLRHYQCYILKEDNLTLTGQNGTCDLFDRLLQQNKIVMMVVPYSNKFFNNSVSRFDRRNFLTHRECH